MQHSEPYENEALMSDEDHQKLQTIGRWMVGSMVVVLCGMVVTCIVC